jgi:MFS family permease
VRERWDGTIAAMSRDLRLLAGAAGLSALGDFVGFLPLVVHVQHASGSAFAVAGLFLALWGPVVVGAGLAGAIVDRFENRALLVGASFAQAAIVVAIAFSVDELALLIPLVALLGVCVAVVQPAEFALVPAAAGEQDLGRANGRMETARALGFLLGPVLGGALGAAGLLTLALVVNAVSFAVVGIAGLVLRARRRPAHAAEDRVRARDGLGVFVRERELAITLAGAVAALSLFTMSQTAEPFFATDVLHAGTLGYGILISAWTLGMVAGAAGLAHRVPAAHLAVVALVALVVQGAGLAGAGAASVLAVAVIGCAVGGTAHGAKNALLRTLIHERTPADLRGRAFATYNGARNGAELGALLLGGLFVGLVGARGTMLAAGLGGGLIGLLALLFLSTRTIERRSAAHARIQG